MMQSLSAAVFAAVLAILLGACASDPEPAVSAPAIEASSTTTPAASTSSTTRSSSSEPVVDQAAEPLPQQGGCREALRLYPGGLDWAVTTEPHTLAACRDGEAVSTIEWGGGMGEFLVSMDSNGDGVEEVFVGGTAVSGGGGEGFSLIDDELVPLTLEGNHLNITSGFIETLDSFGCKDGSLVQVSLTSEGSILTATRKFLVIVGPEATVADTETLTWTVDAPMRGSEDLWVEWNAHPELVNDLTECTVDLPID